MRHIGDTPDGNAIIELSLSEQQVLYELQSAMDGNHWNWQKVGLSKVSLATDMSDSFRAVLEFVKARFAVNKMKAAVIDLEKRLENIEGKGE